MKMKSIRLDFTPANGLSNEGLKNLLIHAIKNAADTPNPRSKEALEAMLVGAHVAEVNDYDGRYGGPVFYIP